MSEQSPRDTQFAGFARLLAEDCARLPIDLHESAEEANARFQLLLAQRAYDLVRHVIWNIKPIDLDRESPDEHVLLIPDMTE